MFDVLNLRSFQIPPNRNDWPEGAFPRSKFGQDVLWRSSDQGGHHLLEEELEPYRQIGDAQVDNILKSLEQDGNPLGPGDDLIALAEQATADLTNATPVSSSTRQQLKTFLQHHQTLPSWVDIPQLERGQNVFLKYMPAISLSLYYRSLVAGFSIPKIAAVIRSTGYLAPPSRPHQVLQRLMDTGQLIASCVGFGVEELLPGGMGWRTALHVRVLHAKVRHGLLRRKGAAAWDTCELGVPINQEDLAGTLLAFSTNAIFGIEFVAGSSIGRQDMLDYLALWRYIGWLLGVETADGETKEQCTRRPLDPCGPGYTNHPDPVSHSSSMLMSIIFHILDPDESSVEISHHLLKISRETQTQPPSKQASSVSETTNNDWFYFRALQCRRFIGDPLADALCLPLHPNLKRRWMLWVASTLYLVVLRVYTLAVMFISPFRRRMVRFHKNTMQKVHKEWLQTHQSKMAKALRHSYDGDGLGVEKGDFENKMEEIDDRSCCPFAMIAPPKVNVKPGIKKHL